MQRKVKRCQDCQAKTLLTLAAVSLSSSSSDQDSEESVPPPTDPWPPPSATPSLLSDPLLPPLWVPSKSEVQLKEDQHPEREGMRVLRLGTKGLDFVRVLSASQC